MQPWQDYIAAHYDRFRGSLYKRLRRYTPEEREERIQEALAQICVRLSWEESRGMVRLTYWSVYCRRAASDVARGRRCTRPDGRNADTLDKPHYNTGLFPEESPFAPNVKSQVVVTEFLGRLPAQWRRVAELLLACCTLSEIACELAVSLMTVSNRRRDLRNYWVEYVSA